MSRCAHGRSPANSLRKSPALIAPPPRGPTLFKSATSLLRCSRYSSISGSCQSRSPANSPASSNREHLKSEVADLNRSEEHTSELQSHSDLVCRLLLEKKK